MAIKSILNNGAINITKKDTLNENNLTLYLNDTSVNVIKERLGWGRGGEGVCAVLL